MDVDVRGRPTGTEHPRKGRGLSRDRRGVQEGSGIGQRVRSPYVKAISALVCALAFAGCAGATMAGPVQTTSSPKAHLAAGRPAHIAVIVMENEEYGDVIGSSSTPYINGLANTYGLA